MHAFRSHTCGELRAANVGQSVRLSGWIHRKREHANALFIDLRDHYGITQIVVSIQLLIFMRRQNAVRPKALSR